MRGVETAAWMCGGRTAARLRGVMTSWLCGAKTARLQGVKTVVARLSVERADGFWGFVRKRHATPAMIYDYFANKDKTVLRKRANPTSGRSSVSATKVGWQRLCPL